MLRRLLWPGSEDAVIAMAHQVSSLPFVSPVGRDPGEIPDLQQRIRALTLALELLVAAVGDASGRNRSEALARAERVLAESNSHRRPASRD